MQATLNAREGRVMIYNLVEAAQEFLSEVVPLEKPHVMTIAAKSHIIYIHLTALKWDNADYCFLFILLVISKECCSFK